MDPKRVAIAPRLSKNSLVEILLPLLKDCKFLLVEILPPLLKSCKTLAQKNRVSDPRGLMDVVPKTVAAVLCAAGKAASRVADRHGAGH